MLSRGNGIFFFFKLCFTWSRTRSLPSIIRLVALFIIFITVPTIYFYETPTAAQCTPHIQLTPRFELVFMSGIWKSGCESAALFVIADNKEAIMFIVYMATGLVGSLGVWCYWISGYIIIQGPIMNSDPEQRKKRKKEIDFVFSSSLSLI